MKILRSQEMLHPLLIVSMQSIQELIKEYNIPMRLFETGREHDRHQNLLNKGRSRDIVSCHLFNLEKDPPLYATALSYVFYDNKWSWNIRNSTIKAWYILFGNLVLDLCPSLEWGGFNRDSTDYTYFRLKINIILNNMDKYPCVLV